MKLLNEDILFSANQLQTIKAIVAKSSLSRVVLIDEDEKKLVSNILKRVHKESNKNSTIYLVLKAASFGPDTSRNFLLRYMIDISQSNIVEKYPENVDKVLEYLQSGQISHGDEIDQYLLNANLYSRQDREFEYTLRAFDAVIYHKRKYFGDDNEIEVASNSNLDLGKFFKTDFSSQKQKIGLTALVPINQKYFFSDMQVSSVGEIIPAGLNNSNTFDRTIWNYMELWTNSVERSAKDDKEKENADVLKNKVNKAKEAIKKSNMSDNIQNSIISLIDELS